MGETHVWKTLGGAVRSITNIYSLVLAKPFIDCMCSKTEQGRYLVKKVYVGKKNRIYQHTLRKLIFKLI